MSIPTLKEIYNGMAQSDATLIGYHEWYGLMKNDFLHDRGLMGSDFLHHVDEFGSWAREMLGVDASGNRIDAS
jgi:hypothetical protein